MESTRTRIATLAVVALMALAVVSGGALGALTYDSTSDGTTETTTTSDWLQDTTVTDLDNSSKVSTVEVQSGNATGNDSFTLRATVNETNHGQDGQTIYVTNESWTATNATSGNYELNLTHSTVFEDLERGGDENVTVDVTTVWNETETDEESSTIQIHAQNDGQPHLIADDRAEFKEPGGALSAIAFWSSDDDSADAARMNRSVAVNNTSTTTLTVGENDQNFSDALTASTEDTGSGDVTTDAYMFVNNDPVAVFDTKADAEWLDKDSEAYAVADGGTITVHNVNETFNDSTSQVDVVVAANANLGIRDTAATLRHYDADRRTALAAGLGAGFGATFEADA